MSTHNIYFYGEMWKIIPKLSANKPRYLFESIYKKTSIFLKEMPWILTTLSVHIPQFLFRMEKIYNIAVLPPWLSDTPQNLFRVRLEKGALTQVSNQQLEYHDCSFFHSTINI